MDGNGTSKKGLTNSESTFLLHFALNRGINSGPQIGRRGRLPNPRSTRLMLHRDPLTGISLSAMGLAAE